MARALARIPDCSLLSSTKLFHLMTGFYRTEHSKKQSRHLKWIGCKFRHVQKKLKMDALFAGIKRFRFGEKTTFSTIVKKLEYSQIKLLQHDDRVLA